MGPLDLQGRCGYGAGMKAARNALPLLLIAASGCSGRRPDEATRPAPSLEGAAPPVQGQPEKERRLEEARRLVEAFQKIPEPRRFNMAAALTDDMLMLTQWYEAPFPGYYQRLVVRKNRKGTVAREVPNRGTQGAKFGTLSADQMRKLRRMLGELTLEHTGPMSPVDGERHTAFVFRRGNEVVRHDSIGAPPGEVLRIREFVQDELDRQTTAHYRELVEEALRRGECEDEQ